MKPENINLANALFNELAKIQAQKEELQNIAEVLLNNNETKNEFSLSVDIVKPKQEVSSLEHGNQTENKEIQMFRFEAQSDAYKFIQSCKDKIANESKIEFRISQNVSLQMLGLILGELNLKEYGIIKDLKKLGINFKK